MFLLDGSSEVARKNFDKSLVFVKAVSTQFNASEDGAHVSVAVYSEDTQIIFPLKEHFNQTDINKNIDKIKHPNQGKRNLGKALESVNRDVFKSSGRSGAQKILVVITSGNSTDIIYPSLNELGADNVRVIGVSMEQFGAQQILPQLQEMASSTGGVALLEDFTHLPTASAMENMKNRISQSK